jgi:pimeloyl-ACP methyl ester carboxylesterase
VRLRMTVASGLGLLLAASVATGPASAAAPPAAAPAAAAAQPVFGDCPEGTIPGGRCGTVTVPLDRAHPAAGTIPIAFEFYAASDTTAPAISTIVPSTGGPGISNIAVAALWVLHLQPVLDRHNLLIVDHRGMGLSGAIDCPGLQHVQGDQKVAARDCGAQLGATSDRYGSADVADDIDDVRAALGLGGIDYFGQSYGATDVRAYAYRHPDQLRSAILDSPDFTLDGAFFPTLPGAMARISALVCRRSPSCAAADPDPDRTLDTLVRRVQRHPVTGTALDPSGTPHQVTVDEQGLLGILYNDYFADPSFLNQGEIFAAATALARGDSTPLLRLATESPSPSDFGDPTSFSSVGADYAVFCADSTFPWDKNAPEPVRQRQYDTALRRLPARSTAPFSTRAWAGFIASQPTLLIPGADACVPWPEPTRPEPPFPANAVFPRGVPALLFGGGLDYLDIRAERTLLPLFPSGRFITVANSGHGTTNWSPCALTIALTFLSTLHSGDTRCAADPDGAMMQPFGAATGKVQSQGVAGFPTRVRDAVPAADDRTVPGRAGRADRQLAAAAWSTVEDAVYRLPRLAGPTGHGLRGGSYAVTRSDAGVTITLSAARFTRDLAVSGTVTLDAASTLTGTVTLAGAATGRLTVHGVLWDPDQPTATVRGTVAGRRVAVLTQTR